MVFSMLSIYRNFKKPEQTVRDEIDNPVLKQYLEDAIKNRRSRCCRCGYTAPKFQLCINETCDDTNIKPVIVCPLCYMTERLEIAAEYNVGTLIWLPEMSQVGLNYITHIIFNEFEKKKRPDSGILSCSEVESLYARYFTKIYELNNMFNKDAHDPIIMASSLSLLSENDYKNRGEILYGVRFILRKDTLAPMFQYYSTRIYPKLEKGG